MNEIIINGQVIKLPGVYDNSVLIRDTFNMNFKHDKSNPKKISKDSVIGVGNEYSISSIARTFNSLSYKIAKGKTIAKLIYLDSYRKMMETLKHCTLSKCDIHKCNKELYSEIVDESFSFSGVEVQSIEETSEVGENFNKPSHDVCIPKMVVLNSDGSTYSADQEITNNYENVIDVEYRIDPSQNTKSFGSKTINEVEYVPQQEQNESLLSRLKKINSEGPVFIDEERLLDKNLSVSNSISLNKINFSKLDVNSDKLCKVDISNSRILEMDNDKYCALKNTISKVKVLAEDKREQINEATFKIKSKLNCKFGQKNHINVKTNLLAEMPKRVSEWISNGSSKLNNRKEQLNDLLSLREKIIEENSNVDEDQDFKAKVA